MQLQIQINVSKSFSEDKQINRNFPDYTKPFCVNGLEIDLTELELYEKQLAAKRLAKMNSGHSTAESANDKCTDHTIDEIDAYLDQLALDLKANDESKGIASRNTEQNPNSQSLCPTGSNHSVPNRYSNQTVESQADTDASTKTTFPLLLFGFLSILAFVNTFHCKNALN